MINKLKTGRLFALQLRGGTTLFITVVHNFKTSLATK